MRRWQERGVARVQVAIFLGSAVVLRNSPHTGGVGAIVNRPLARLVRGIAGFEVILLIDLYDVIF